MTFFSFQDITAAGDCRSLVTDVLGGKVSSDGRCAAVWRNGDNPTSVSVEKDKWYDHRMKEGGSIIDLCATAKFGGDKQKAQEFLGEWLRLTPKSKTRHANSIRCKYDKLIEDGWKEKARYFYRDETGETRHIVVRFWHPKKPGAKEFLQRTEQHWGTDGVRLLLYNLPQWKDSPNVIIVEGEKDADSLAMLGIPATCNVGGSGKWLPHYNDWLTGKDIVICRDNDDAGEEHTRLVSINALETARSVKVICPSGLEKGDITDWLTKEGGTKDKLRELIRAAEPLRRDVAVALAQDVSIDNAKRANAKPLSNCNEEENIVNGKIRIITVPRKLNEILADVNTRFLGFPRRLGEFQLFVHDRKTNETRFLKKTSALFAWMNTESDNTIVWKKTDGAPLRDELFYALMHSTRRYEKISAVPSFPDSADTYCTFGEIPPPSANLRTFFGFLDFFCPATPEHKTLIAAAILAPMFYIPSIPRPCWVIDAQDGASTGKTTLVESIATLYGSAIISTNQRQLRDKFDELIKRLVSADGRRRRFLLCDNVNGVFNSDRMSELITSSSINGLAPYGEGEESRPNDITYFITANSSQLNHDMSTRSFAIVLKMPESRDGWAERLNAYMKANQRQIIADIHYILSAQSKRPFTWKTRTRFPDFERFVLAAVCTDETHYNAVCECIRSEAENTDVEGERGAFIAEVITENLRKLDIQAEYITCFIRTEVIEKWFDPKRTSVSDIRNLAKQGFIRQFDKDIRRFPAHSCKERRSGLLWRAPAQVGTDVPIIGLTDATPSVVAIILNGVDEPKGNKASTAAQTVFD